MRNWSLDSVPPNRSARVRTIQRWLLGGGSSFIDRSGPGRRGGIVTVRTNENGKQAV